MPECFWRPGQCGRLCRRTPSGQGGRRASGRTLGRGRCLRRPGKAARFHDGWGEAAAQLEALAKTL